MQRLTFFLLSSLLFLYSCHQEGLNSYEPALSLDDNFEMKEEYDANGNAHLVNSKPIERRIIRNAKMDMQVEDIKKAFPKIESLVKNLNGYISSSDMQNNNYRISNNLVIRVPNDNLDTLLQLIENQSIFINSSSISSTDVTEEFIDIETRLKTKREVRERYLDILSKKAKTVEDVLLAEEQIRVLTEEIEAKEGRLRYLKNRVNLSTLTLSIYQKVEYVAPPNVYEKSFLTKIKEGFVNGWDILLNLILGLINIWPLVILFVVFVWKRKAIWGKIRRKK
jgi:hypothetical protein